MKKILLLASAVSLFLSTSICSANSFIDMLPNNTDIYVSFNTSSKNVLQEYLISEIPQMFAKNLFADSTDQNTTQKDSIIKTYKDLLSNNVLEMGVNTSEEFIFALKATDTQYQNFINALGTKAKIVSDNPQIYSTTLDNFFFTKQNGIFIFSDTQEKILSALNNNNGLSNNSVFKDVSGEFSSDDNINFYLSTEILKNAFKGGPKDLQTFVNFSDLFNGFGMTIQSKSNGINAKMITSFNPENAQKFGLGTTAHNFTPVLYKSMPSDNPIFYSEFSNLKASIDTLASIIAQDTGSDFKIPAEIEPYLALFNKEIAIYIQKDDQILPAITILVNTSDNKDLTSSIVNMATSALENELQTSNTSYDKSTNKNLTTFTFDLNKLDPKGQIPDGINKISLTIGTTSEGYFIVSTYSKISTKYGEGLDKNSKFKNALSNLNQTVSGISYINLENLASWYDQILSFVAQTSTNKFTQDQISTARDLLKKIQSPWHDLSIISKTTPTYSTSEINFNFDLNSIDANYIKNIADFGKVSNKSFTSFENSRKTFNDTPNDAWYYSDVKDLNARGVINGYQDQSFKPNNNITRAEFLTMVLRAFDDSNFESSTSTDSQFKDVNSSDWFSKAVNLGVSEGIISGYSDNTFRPNNPINRAEAVGILNKMLKYKYGESLNLPTRNAEGVFNDVTPNDWFYQDVQKIYSYSIIDGDQNSNFFRPGRNLNRAEASKIINKALKGLDETTK